MNTSIENERWGIVASTPPLNPAEVETHHRAVEVVVMWGDDVLSVEHVSPPRDVRIDTKQGAHPVVIERDGRLLCVLPEGATGEVTINDEARSLESLREAQTLESFGELAGAVLYPLPEGASARVRHDGLTFLVRPTHAGKEVASAAELQWRRYGWVALSLGVHAVLLAMFYFMPPSSQALSLDNIDANTRMVEYLNAANAVEEVDIPEFLQEPSDDAPGGDGERHALEEGQAGDPDEAVTGNRQAVRGPQNNPDPHMARENLRNEMEHVGAIGAVASMLGSFDAPTSPFGRDSAEGMDPMSAIGALMGDQIGSNHGFNGLGMTGTGRGAGGTGLGTYGLGTLGTMGRGSGGGDGDGYGRGVGTPHGTRRSRVPRVRPGGGVDIRGSLSREAIRRVVRRNIAQVRFCYEQGLQQNPSIEGRVTVSWIISPTGAVTTSSVANTTLRNASVESCIANAVGRWSFPSPDGGGVVGVSYPFMLQSPN